MRERPVKGRGGIMQQWNTLLRVVTCAAVAVIGALAPPMQAAANSADQGLVVDPDPVDFTPNVLDGHIEAITVVGDRVVVGGEFTQVQQIGDTTVYSRNHLFAFDRTTGALDMDFVPEVDGRVYSLAAAPDGTSVFVGGKFSNVNGVGDAGVTKLDTTDGSQVAGFDADTAGKVRDLVYHGGKVYLGGDIWSVNGVLRPRLAAVDAATGALDTTLTIGPTLPRVSVDWVDKLDVSPDGTELVIIGNFLEVDDQPRAQIAVIDLTGSPAVLSPWSTNRFAPTCSPGFWNYVRDVEFDPTSSYFVVPSTGWHDADVIDWCDAVVRFEAKSTASAAVETWANWTGGDTLSAVAISDAAVYVGGHQRWMNAGEGYTGYPGRVPREGIAALDPLSGMPLTWNPGKGRGVAVFDMHLTGDALYIGSDTDFTAGEYHAKLAQFPLAGGAVPPLLIEPSLPTTLFSGGPGMAFTARSFDGLTVGTATALTGAIDWDTSSGAFEALDAIYSFDSNGMHMRSFDGVAMGPQIDVDTWPNWLDVTSATLLDGRLYFTEAGNDDLMYRRFSLESNIVSSQTYVASGPTVGDGLTWSDATGLTAVDGALYSTRTDGSLSSFTLVGASPDPVSEVLISGPAIDGITWPAGALFAHNPDAHPVITLDAPTDGDTLDGVTPITFSATVTDDVAVAQVDFAIDGVSVGVDTDGTDGWSLDWDASTSAGADLVLVATATDSVGQMSSATLHISVDVDVPTTSLSAPASGSIVASTVSLTANATDDVEVTGVEFSVDGASLGVDVDGADGWSFDWDSTAAPEGPAVISVIATDRLGRTATDSVAVTVENTTVGVVALIVGNTDLGSGDTVVAARLNALGYAVLVIDDADVSLGSISGASLAIVSSSANSLLIADTLNDSPIPLWVAKPWLLDDVGLTAATGGAFGTTSTSSIDIADPVHPLAAGRSGNVAVTTSSKTVSTGTPAAAAEIVASANGAPTTFVYPAGSTLADGSTAAGCRLTSSIFQTAPSVFTADGWALFDIAAGYAASGCQEPTGDDPPTVAITTPIADEIVTGSVSVSATASDDVGVEQVEFFVDHVSIAVDTDGTDGYGFTWDTTLGNEGAALVHAVASDFANQTTASAEVAVLVDNDDPLVVFTNPLDGATVAGAVPVTVDAGDGSGVAQVEFFVDGASAAIDTDGTDGYGFTWDSTTALDGPVALSATVLDNNNTSTTEAVTVGVANAATGIVTLVVGNLVLDPGEIAIRDRWLAAGFVVNVVDDNDAAVTDANGVTFVVVGSTANSNLVGDMYVDSVVPVWLAKPYAFDDMGLTATTAGDYGTSGTSTVEIVDDTHPLAAGLSGTVSFTTGTRTVSRGVPQNDGVAVATASNGAPTIFVYRPGDLMADGSTAPACRFSFPIFKSGPTYFTADGWSLFDAATAHVAANCV